jgi:hypothetical protein
MSNSPLIRLLFILAIVLAAALGGKLAVDVLFGMLYRPLAVAASLAFALW